MQKDKCKSCESLSIKNINLYGTEFIFCKDCGIHYLANIPYHETISDYYKNNYKLSSFNIIDAEFRHLFRSTEQYELLSIIQSLILPPAKILDIGCDKSFLLDLARRFGYEELGIELSEEAIKYAKSINLNIENSLSNVNTKFDIILMQHSLEHLTEPVKYLSNLKKYLNKDAYLLIRVPDFSCKYRKIFKKYWIRYQINNHIFHFSIKSLKSTLALAGFDTVKIIKRKPNNKFTKAMFKISYSFF